MKKNTNVRNLLAWSMIYGKNLLKYTSINNIEVSKEKFTSIIEKFVDDANIKKDLRISVIGISNIIDLAVGKFFGTVE